MPIHDWEVGLLEDMVQTEFDLRVLCMCGRPPVRCTHGERRFVLVGDSLYDIDALQRMYLDLGMCKAFERLAPCDLEDPQPSEPADPADTEPVSPQQARRDLEYTAFWPLLRDLVIVEVAHPIPHAFELRNLAPRMATMAPDLFLLDDEPQSIPERVLQQLIAEEKLQHLSSDARRRIVVVSGTPETLRHARQIVLPRWRPAMRSSNRTGRRRDRRA